METLKTVKIPYSRAYGEYRVPHPCGRKSAVYFTCDREDALKTAAHMWQGHNVAFKVQTLHYSKDE